MTPIIKSVKQRKLHDPTKGINGDCWKCCIASLMQFEYHAVPNFGDLENPFIAETFVNMWLIMYRKTLRRTINKPKGFSIATGPSPRFKDIDHCVIAYNGIIEFDPHPEGTGLESIKFYEVIEDM